MLKQIIKNLNLDNDYSERSQLIDVYNRILNGELYDGLSHAFCDEYDSMGNYIPLHKRQPSVRNGLCKVVVDQSVSLLFGNDHFPSINTDDVETTDKINEIAKCIQLKKVMTEAAIAGSVGSVAVFLRIIDDEIQIEVKSTQYLTPYFAPDNPTRLIRLVEKYKVKGKDLIEAGYTVAEEKDTYWFMREWNETEEICYKPFKKGDDPKRDDERSTAHDLGFVPIVWIRNLPKPSTKGLNEIDGSCTFKAAIDSSIEIDYLLSQGGRGLKYSSDPLVVFKLENEYSMSQNQIVVSGDISNTKRIVKSSSNAFVLGKDDDAKMLEINGRAAEAIINHVRYLRELAMESIHGNRSHADKIAAAQSGSAMEKLQQSLIWLADMLRIYYGDNGIIPLIKMIINASKKVKITINNKQLPVINDINIKLKWPQWYPPSEDELSKQANSLKTLTGSGLLSKETGVATIADHYGIVDKKDEINKIEADQKKLMEELKPTVQERISV